MIFKKNSCVFQSCEDEYDAAKVVIFSSPMDATCSFRPGTRFAGPAIRVDSIGLEWYSPYFDLSLKDFSTCDIGDLEFPMGDVEADLNVISATTKQILTDKKIPVMIGGEHLTTYGVIRELIKVYPSLHIIHFDAHTDLREDFLGRELSHATVLRKCYDLGASLHQFGIRSGDKSEFEWAKTHSDFHKFNLDGLKETIEKIKNENVYITIDLDVLDPSVFPGTGTPEAGGITYKELQQAILDMKKLTHIVGADIVELSPHYDASGVSTAVACKTLREILLLIHSTNKN